ncbi:MAG: hypothetical protein Q8P02_02350 [Candidatus Micrarchaeota archaeon]|nr:hypothetical protein [Candidatus Micrarchaeota archaeon]
MLITTSRKPSDQVKAMARTLAKGLGAHYHNRGKAGVEAVLTEAEKKGASRVLFLWARHGNPDRIVVFDAEKGWLKPELAIRGFVFERAPFRAQGCDFSATDASGARFAALFEAKPGPNQILLSGQKLELYSGGVLRLELRFKGD